MNGLMIGLMSGTSADGIDAVLVECTEGKNRSWKVVHTLCKPWSLAMRGAILDACRHDAPLQQITVLNVRLAEHYANVVLQLAEEAGIDLSRVYAISCHGQTVWHQPTPIEVGDGVCAATLQLGDAAVLAARTGCKVVSNFRAADMALGGQGAPLVPYADYLLLKSDVESRATLNIGGIANLTYMPVNCSPDSVVAFDTGPGNMLIDAVTSHLVQSDMDTNGLLAEAGTANRILLKECMAHPYLDRLPPKSTGREEFGTVYAKWFLNRVSDLNLTTEDALATATQFTADSIEQAFKRYVLPHGSVDTVIVGGGGLRNTHLINLLRQRLLPARLDSFMDYGINPDTREALAFAIFGWETLHNRPSTLPSVTGASKPAILGCVSYPPPG